MHKLLPARKRSGPILGHTHKIPYLLTGPGTHTGQNANGFELFNIYELYHAEKCTENLRTHEKYNASVYIGLGLHNVYVNTYARTHRETETQCM